LKGKKKERKVEEKKELAYLSIFCIASPGVNNTVPVIYFLRFTEIHRYVVL